MQKYLFSICLSVISLYSVQAQWVQTPGPEGANFSDIAVTPSAAVLFSDGIANFMYRSTDFGLSWNRIAESYFPQYIGGDTLVNLFDSLFRISTDGALSWTSKSMNGIGQLDNLAVNRNDFFTVIHNSNSDWTTSGNFWIIYRSTDRGRSWDSVSEIPQGQFVPTIGISSVGCSIQPFGNFLLATSGGANNSSKIYRSTDEGLTWSSVYTGTLGNIIDNGAFLLGYNLSGIVISTDQGQRWQSETTGTSLDRSSTAANISNTFWDSTALFVSTFDSGLYRFDGTSWNLVDSTLSVVAFGCRDGVDFALSAITGVLRSTDHGVTWSDANRDMTATSVSGIVTMGTNAVAQTSSGPFYSPDEGATWHRVAIARSLTTGGALASDDSTLYLSAEDKLFRSKDGGVTWNLLASPQPGGRIANMAANGPLMVLCSEWSINSGFFPIVYDTVFISVDRGASWMAQTINSQGPLVVAIFGTMIFVWNSDSIYRSANNGQTWQSSVLPGNLFIQNITQAGTTLLASGYNALLNASSSDICISTDNGINWSIQNTTGLNSQSIPYLLAVKGSVLALEDSTIFVSRNLGASFQPFGTGFSSVIDPVNVAFSDHYVLVGTYSNSVWRRSITDITGGVASKPTISLLFTNEPNPFRSQTTLRYSISQASFVSIELFDALGRSITSIFRGFENTGLHSTTVDGHELRDGIYICRMIADGETTSTALVKN